VCRSLTASLATGVAWSALASFAALAAAPDWPQVPSHTVTLFYPGQSSYD